MSEALKSLLEKIEKAEGPDREIDAEIAVATGWLTEYTESMDQHGALKGYQTPDGEQHPFAASWWPREVDNKFPPTPQTIVANIHSLPKFTASVDAALALADKKLPGVSMSIHRKRYPSFSGPDRGEVFLYVHPGAAGGDIDAWYNQGDDVKPIWPGTIVAKTLPLAICAALLSVLIAMEGQDG